MISLHLVGWIVRGAIRGKLGEIIEKKDRRKFTAFNKVTCLFIRLGTQKSKKSCQERQKESHVQVPTSRSILDIH